MYVCGNVRCGHHQIWPPIAETEIPVLYAKYSTHRIQPTLNPVISAVVGMIALICGLPDGLWWKLKSDRFPTGLETDSRLLDVGCGAGEYLRTLRSGGYPAVQGVDFDEAAVAVARSQGLQVTHGEVTDVEDDAFDFVTLRHVIEHVPDPVATLRSCSAKLARGGLIYIRTPNARSNLARLFQASWRGWEPPRHLNVFTMDSLRAAGAAAGLQLGPVHTSNVMIQSLYLESVDLRVGRLTGPKGRAVRTMLRLLLPLAVFWVSVRRRLAPNSGEELVVEFRANPRQDAMLDEESEAETT